MRNTVSQSELMATERSLTRDNKADSDMIDEHFEVALVTIVGGPTEDDWGPITAAVMFFVILAGLIVYGSGAHL